MDEWTAARALLTATDPLVQVYVDGVGVLVIFTEAQVYCFRCAEDLIRWTRRPDPSVRHG